jgi:glycosyltransferase involved in cell wall biosynthesis
MSMNAPTDAATPGKAYGSDRRSIAALGDVLDPNCFGGSPCRFLEESRRLGFAENGWRVDTGKLKAPRLAWNLCQVARGRRPGGFQFSKAGRSAALSQIPPDLVGTDVISFHQHFPDPGSVAKRGGELSFYIDATYTQLFPAYGYDRILDPKTRSEAIAYERSAFEGARRVVVSQTWTERSLRADYSIDPRKCAVILPAANYPAHPGLRPPPGGGRAGRDRPFVLGFIGKDWRRKGLVYLDRVAKNLRSRGWKVHVRAIGFPREDGPQGAEVECLGFIDKRRDFGPFLHSCDVGCLFSSAEAAGIAVLEFLGVGVPVAGFTVNGLADLIPASGGFRFGPEATPEDAADVFEGYLGDEAAQERYRAAAEALAPMLVWERCVREFIEFWSTGRIERPFRIHAPL